MTEANSEHPAGRTIHVARVIGTARDTVYAAWNDAAGKKAWWGKTDKATLTECTMDVRVGGAFRYVMTVPGKDTPEVASGTFQEIHAPRRMVFTWTSGDQPADPKDTRVTMDFIDLNDGTTRVAVTHEGLPNLRVAEVHRAAWSNMLQDFALADLR